MSESKESPVIIPMIERDPVLEEKVQYYLQLVQPFPKNTLKPQRVILPDTRDDYELEIFRREEVRRIKEGHFGMSPKYYFFYNYCKMDSQDGLIRPEFRICQQEFFKEIEKAQASEEFSLIAVKRRRIGASWMVAADVMHDCITRPFFKVGMNSKTERDSVELFKKVKFVYDNLPDWLKPTSSYGNTRTSMDFSYRVKDSAGNWTKKGTQSYINVVAPVPTAYEGQRLNKLVLDEIGKYPIRSLWSYSQDCLMDGHKRKGLGLMFGTAGDITAEGKDLKEFWYNANIYKFNQFFLAGYMGILVDDYGNDLTEEAIRWIVYERKRREGLSNKEYSDFLQQYPLTVGEAFTSNTEQGLGNLVKINSQLRKLDENPIHAKKGYFLKDTNGGVKFIPDNRGTFKIYEDVTPGVENLFLAACDPTDHTVEDTRDVSSLAMYILKKQHGIERPKIVAEYCDRPNVPSDFYEQAVLALQYYNNCKILIERNRYGMIQFFEQIGCKYLLMTEPTGYKTVFQGTWVSRIGIHMSKTTKKILEDCVVEYIEDNCDLIPSKELLMDFKEYGARNVDRCFTENHYVETVDGHKLISNVEKGDMVLTHIGRYRPVVEKYITTTKSKLIKISVMGAYKELECTPNHPFLIARRPKKPHGINWMARKFDFNEPEWIAAKDIKQGDHFIIPKRINLKHTNLSYDELYLLGWWLSDGYTSKSGQVKITFQGDQLHIAEFLKEKIIDLYFKDFEQPIYERDEFGRFPVKLPVIKKHYKANCYMLTFTSKKFSELVNKCTINKHLKPELYNSKGLLPLVLGLYEGDGSQSISIKKDGHIRTNLTIGMCNFVMMLQLRQILIDEGIWSTSYYAKPRNNAQKPQLRLSICIVEDIHKITTGSLKFQKITIPRPNFKKLVIEKDYGFLVPVRNITEMDYDGLVYNLEVEEDHSYTVFGISTHNCMAFGIALIALTNDQTKLKQLSDGKKHIPNWSYKNVGGKVVRIRPN